MRKAASGSTVPGPPGSRFYDRVSSGLLRGSIWRKMKRASTLRLEHASIVSQLSQGSIPFQPGEDLLRPGVGQRGLSRKKIEHRPNSRLVAAQGNLIRLLSTGDQITRGAHPTGRSLEGVVRAEDL